VISMTASSGHAKVSVILVNYGAAERTRQAAAALLASTRVELQVIVVDNASPPSDSDALTRLDSRVTLIQNPRNEGFAAGCNRGAVDADGDYLLFMNPDV